MHMNGESLPVRVEAIDNHDPIRKFERVELPVHSYLKLAQIRGERNPVTTELKQSIMAEGLLYEPISARVPGELLGEYVEFVNELWGADVSPEDLEAYRQDDDTYYLIVAGHSRHQAFEELMDEGKLAQDQVLPTKMANVTSVWDIIKLQRADNIHSAPPKERNAMATVEAYEWGRKKGDWAHMSEFVEHSEASGEKISVAVLREMRYFSNLPGAIRTFVLGGSIPYSVGIEMGKGADEIRRYYALEAGYRSYDEDKMSTKDRKNIDRLTTLALNIDCMRMVQVKESGRRFTIAAGKGLVQGTVSRYKEKADKLDPSTRVGGGFEDELFQLEDPLTSMVMSQTRELQREARDLVGISQGATLSFIKDHIGQGQLPEIEVAKLASALEQRAEEARKVRRMAEEARSREAADGVRRARQVIMGGTGLAVAELAEIVIDEPSRLNGSSVHSELIGTAS